VLNAIVVASRVDVAKLHPDLLASSLSAAKCMRAEWATWTAYLMILLTGEKVTPFRPVSRRAAPEHQMQKVYWTGGRAEDACWRLAKILGIGQFWDIRRSVENPEI
jgi:hypothetical protein